MIKVTTYRLEKDLPRYPAGTIIHREQEFLPSQYARGGDYLANESWFTVESSRRIRAIDYVGQVIDRALTDYNIETSEWVNIVEGDESWKNTESL